MGFKWAIPSGAPSRARLLQLAGCAVLAWVWLRSEPVTETKVALPPQKPAENSRILRPPEQAPQQAGFGLPNVLGGEAIEVIVSRNDTLDRIFRRLKLDLSDLATMRNLPDL